MTTNLNTFKSVWSPVGFAPTNRFHFLLTPPPGMFGNIELGINGIGGQIANDLASSAAGAVTEQLLSFACKKADLPSSAFNSVGININGTIKNRAAARDYDPVTMEFYVDSQHIVRQFFLTWHNLILNSFNKSRSYPKDYLSAQSSLVLYDNANRSLSPTQDVIFANMWPSEIGPITYDWADENTPAILPVTFHYDYYYNAWQEGLFKSFVNRGIRSIINTLPGGGLF